MLYRLLFLIALSLFTTGYCLNRNLCIDKMNSAPPMWMIKQIEKDLKAFEVNGIHEKDLDKAMLSFANNHLTLRCKLINHKVFFYNHDKVFPVLSNEPDYNHIRFKTIQYLLKFLTICSDLPDVDFILSLEDGLTEQTAAPVMAFGKNKCVDSLVAFPDFEILHGYKHIIKEVEAGINNYPFEEKISKAFWRGSTTGGCYTLSNWREHPRSKLVLFSQEHPDILDAKFTNVVSDSDKKNLQKELLNYQLLSKNISIHDHLAFKYLIDIDGNNCTYSRLFWILISNSLCFKPISNNEQWYYSALEPYVHYIPLKADLSDLLEKVLWAENHQEEVKTIIKHANEFARANLMQEDVFNYVYHLLKAYAKLQRFNPKI